MTFKYCLIIIAIFVTDTYSMYDYDRPQSQYSHGQHEKLHPTVNQHQPFIYEDVYYNKQEMVPQHVSENTWNTFNTPQQNSQPLYLVETEQHHPVYESQVEQHYPIIIMKPLNSKKSFIKQDFIETSKPNNEDYYNPQVGIPRSHKHKSDSWFYSSPNWNMNSAANTNILRAADPRYLVSSDTHFLKIKKPGFGGYAGNHYGGGTNVHKNTHINVYNRNAQTNNDEEMKNNNFM